MHRSARALASVLAGVTICGIGFITSASATPRSSRHSRVQHAKIHRGGTLTIAEVGMNPTGLDPQGTHDSAQRFLYSAIFDSLFNVNEKTGGVYPSLALSYKTSNAGKTITLQLRHGVKFSDGTPFNASAVVFNFNREASQTQNSECLGDLLNFKSAKAIGKYTVRLDFTRPDPQFISLISAAQCGYMVSPAAVQKEGSNFINNPVGTGPFVLTTNIPGSRRVLVANPHYWRKGYPLVHEIVNINFGTAQAADACVASGQCQLYMSAVASDMSAYGNNPAVKFIHAINQTPQLLWLQTSTAPFDNPKARLAVAEAIDTKALVALNTASNGVQFATVATGPIPKQSWAYPGPNIGYPSYDPKAAAALVKSIPGGLNFSITCSTDTASTTICEAIQSQLQAVGMKVTINPDATYFRVLHTFQFQAVFAGANISIPPADPDLFLGDVEYSSSPRNSSQLKDPVMDQLIQRSEAVFNHQFRKAVYKKMAKQFAKDLPQILLYNRQEYEMYNSHLFHWVNLPNYTPGAVPQLQDMNFSGFWVS